MCSCLRGRTGGQCGVGDADAASGQPLGARDWSGPPSQLQEGRGWVGLASGRRRWAIAGVHTLATCHTFLLGSAFSHAQSWHQGIGHAGTCRPDPRKVGEVFLWAWGQGLLQVETRPGVGELGCSTGWAAAGGTAHTSCVLAACHPAPTPAVEGREHGAGVAGEVSDCPFQSWPLAPGPRPCCTPALSFPL